MRTVQLLPLLAPALVWAATLAPAPLDAVGAPLPAVALEGFTQTKATSLEDYSGRALAERIGDPNRQFGTRVSVYWARSGPL